MIVGWADVFSRQLYKDIILESFEYNRKNKVLELFANVIMTNHVHAIMRSKKKGGEGAVQFSKGYKN